MSFQINLALDVNSGSTCTLGTLSLLWDLPHQVGIFWDLLLHVNPMDCRTRVSQHPSLVVLQWFGVAWAKLCQLFKLLRTCGKRFNELTNCVHVRGGLLSRSSLGLSRFLSHLNPVGYLVQEIKLTLIGIARLFFIQCSKSTSRIGNLLGRSAKNSISPWRPICHQKKRFAPRHPHLLQPRIHHPPCCHRQIEH